MEYKQIFKAGKTLMYKIQYKNNLRNINAKIDKKNQILVTAPAGTSFDIIHSFIFKHFEKFYNFIQKQEENSLINLDKNFIYIKGYKYDIQIKIITSGRQKYEIIGNKIYLFLKDEENKQKMVSKIFYDIGNSYLIERSNKLAKKYKFDVPGGFETKWYNSKWGQCEVRLKKITLASQLIMFNDEIIDYVIIHELCHLIHANHSKEFWDLVGQFYPNYKWAREKLKFQV